KKGSDRALPFSVYPSRSGADTPRTQVSPTTRRGPLPACAEGADSVGFPPCPVGVPAHRPDPFPVEVTPDARACLLRWIRTQEGPRAFCRQETDAGRADRLCVHHVRSIPAGAVETRRAHRG